MATKKDLRRLKIKKRIRGRLSGTSSRPRMTVFRSNTAIYVQLIDDNKQHTIVSASSKELSEKKSVNKEVAGQLGKRVAEKAIAAGIDSVVFDRNGYLYHGKIKALADGAREGGLKF
ncbi:MAG: 50S ribosomal protein L18 [Flammeovirgaceae bacterium]